MSVIFYSLPVDAPLRITSYYGKRDTGISGASTDHKGIDLGRDFSKSQTNILSVADGVVINNYWNNYRGWVVIIDHGTFKTLSQHLAYKCPLPVGSKVVAGQIIGVMGASANPDYLKIATHLHFEVIYNKIQIDPLPFLLNIQEVEIMRYRTFDDLPTWAKPIIQEWIDVGAINGNTSGIIDLSEDMVRTIVMIDRRVKALIIK